MVLRMIMNIKIIKIIVMITAMMTTTFKTKKIV